MITKITIVHNRRRGSALIAVSIFGAIMTICALFAFRSTLYQKRLAERSQDYLTAMAVAEAGAELAMVELNKEAGTTPVAFAGWSGSGTYKYTEQIKDTGGRLLGVAEVEVSDAGSEPKIVATGYIPNKANARLSRTVQLSTKKDTIPSPFGGFGIFAFEDITFIGNSKAHGNTGSGGSITLQGNADIYGNAQAAGAINLQGNAKVSKKKEANSAPTPPPPIAAPGFNTNLPAQNQNTQIVAYDSKGNVRGVPTSGSAKNASASGNNDMIIPAPATYRLNNLTLTGNSDLKITGSGTVNIYVEDNFEMSGNGTMLVDDGVTVNIVAKKTMSIQGNKNAEVINANSPINIVANKFQLGGNGKVNFKGDPTVTLWVQEELRMRGNSEINEGGNPANLLVFAEGAVDIDLKGNPDVAGVLYAPTANVDMGGNCTWIGAVLARRLSASGNNKIIVDENLLKPTGGSGAYVTAWVEVAPKK